MKTIIKYVRETTLSRELKATPLYIIMIAFSVFMAYMLGWILIASFSTTRGIFLGDLFLDGLSLDNFRKVLVNSDGIRTIINTLIYTIPSSLLLIVICAPAAYVLSRYNFKGNKFIQQLFVLSLSVPGIMITMPIFYHISSLGIFNSRLVLILLFTANSIPFDTYYLSAYFKNISSSYEQSAALDGASQIRTFWEIIFPMAKPAVVTLTIFNLIGKWNSYFLPLIFANTAEMRPIGVWLESNISSMVTTGDYGGMFASVVLAAAPTIILYMFLSNFVLRGVDQGGVKG
ncbi:carbohydrate ABC transporter permease [Aerococcaceae bacterium INB8]|uniref:Carbohydrate ABC transporter permease n=1 Tax=Ruoffia halotolerans TaxID=2748684 RepID=A0A839A7N4_9LACT|nr:carbohydrate ABC transporter permease [Ruoffia halotolerans]MBA5729901.1 carbohydrate ABC transporter permease [Ruoffia halotolerans]